MVTMATPKGIREYLKINNESMDPSSWLNKTEIPSPAEISGAGSTGADEGEIEIPVNRVIGAWETKAAYLSSHYTLLREDAIAPLRNVVSELRAEPHIMENESQEQASIYEKVYIIGYTFANGGLAARITFSLRRAGKKVPWEQSKRLITGSIVALTPAGDMFKTVCRIAVIAARPLAGVQQNPPEIDIYFANPSETEIDPQQEWVMAECRDGYFEGSRHTLRALQKMAFEGFPLSKYLVRMDPEIDPPAYLDAQPLKDLSLLYPLAEAEEGYDSVDIVDDWPPSVPPILDASQYDALQRILTKEVAVVQGPPGTGKTYVSVVALELMLRNLTPGEPPIIVAAHTNHAVDQLLRHVAKFEPDFIRIGGRSADIDTIKPRTLYEIKNHDRQTNPAAPRGPSLVRLKSQTQEMLKLLAPLTDTDHPFSSDLFMEYGLITEAQKKSLAEGAAQWVTVDQPGHGQGDIAIWLGRDLVKANRRTMPEDFGIDIEEIDLEFEQLKEMEAEGKIDDDDSAEALRGAYIVLREPFTGRKTRGVKEEKIKNSLQKQDMWAIDEANRGPVYRYLQQQLKERMREKYRRMASKYAELVLDMKIGRWEVDSIYLRKARVIGMTTTGLSKYRALLQTLRPKVVLIEEAAETLEAYVTAACFESLNHLILVGDHQQLRPHCNVRDLEGEPWFLDVSMFERFVRNELGYSRMIRQRRMIPEIRRALRPIYQDLEDHESVLDRPPVPGMGGVNTFLFSHEWPEASDSHMSKINPEEALMIIAFFDYLVYNGMETTDITVLTFYNGQRKLILKGLRNHPNLQGCFFKVVTVDSYQGEENGIVLLSLVRNNLKHQIGFLSVENRVCVALSRAQRGFYVFGNSQMLSHASPLWWDVVQAMSEEPNRVGFKLPVTCKKHQRTVYVSDPPQFQGLKGGCDLPCRDELPCGHVCALTCHPFGHDMVNCKKPCIKILECEHKHKCLEECYLPCRCACTENRGRPADRTPSPIKLPPLPRQDSLPEDRTPLTGRTQAFRDFAEGGHIESDANFAAMLESQLDLQKADDAMASALFGGGIAEPQKVTLVRTASDANGTSRGIWKGVYGKEEAEVDGAKDETPSLLD